MTYVLSEAGTFLEDIVQLRQLRFQDGTVALTATLFEVFDLVSQLLSAKLRDVTSRCDLHEAGNSLDLLSFFTPGELDHHPAAGPHRQSRLCAMVVRNETLP